MLLVRIYAKFKKQKFWNNFPNFHSISFKQMEKAIIGPALKCEFTVFFIYPIFFIAFNDRKIMNTFLNRANIFFVKMSWKLSYKNKSQFSKIPWNIFLISAFLKQKSKIYCHSKVSNSLFSFEIPIKNS